MFIIFSIVAKAQYDMLPPPDDIATSAALLEKALADYQTIITSSLEFSNKIQNAILNCETKITSKKTECETNCDGANLNALKTEVLGCMRTFLAMASPIDSAEISILKLNLYLKSGLFNNMIEFKTNILNKLNALSENYKQTRTFTANMGNEYSKAYKTLLMSEFAQARATGALAGVIKGTCIHLKSAIDVHRVTLNMKNFTKDFVFWSQFYNTVKGYELVSNSIRANCPEEFKPADYKPIVDDVAAFIKTIVDEKWVRAECAKPKVKAYMGKRCQGTIVMDPYFISALAQVQK